MTQTSVIEIETPLVTEILSAQPPLVEQLSIGGVTTSPVTVDAGADTETLVLSSQGAVDLSVVEQTRTPVEVLGPRVVTVEVGDRAGPPGIPGRDGAVPTPYPFTNAATWTIRHNLGRLVEVSLLDAAAMQFDGDVEQPDLNTAVATHAVPTTGTALVI